ncbi:hypothetical protein Ppa06_56280 [Planomonospora parontospora subsp. parontospora]|uniref:Uncharacterized protein n=2 Tax=Planomonospora parontospora TaxID=58119 RepID=A0AA37BJK8_9ACTN|nr:hypothetical protein GCM10010126_45250 [Planomonospora parontospora]GII11830.1 hypothetical protein Ppa06_56280 [Planomonospora parontospora subsp. parontospora]
MGRTDRAYVPNAGKKERRTHDMPFPPDLTPSTREAMSPQFKRNAREADRAPIEEMVEIAHDPVREHVLLGSPEDIPNHLQSVRDMQSRPNLPQDGGTTSTLPPPS